MFSGVQWFPDVKTLEELSGPVLFPDPKMWRWSEKPWNRMYTFVLSSVLEKLM